jgi:hypothetical protein
VVLRTVPKSELLRIENEPVPAMFVTVKLPDAVWPVQPEAVLAAQN